MLIYFYNMAKIILPCCKMYFAMYFINLRIYSVCYFLPSQLFLLLMQQYCL